MLVPRVRFTAGLEPAIPTLGGLGLPWVLLYRGDLQLREMVGTFLVTEFQSEEEPRDADINPL